MRQGRDQCFGSPSRPRGSCWSQQGLWPPAQVPICISNFLSPVWFGFSLRPVSRNQSPAALQRQQESCCCCCCAGQQPRAQGGGGVPGSASSLAHAVCCAGCGGADAAGDLAGAQQQAGAVGAAGVCARDKPPAASTSTSSTGTHSSNSAGQLASHNAAQRCAALAWLQLHCWCASRPGAARHRRRHCWPAMARWPM